MFELKWAQNKANSLALYGLFVASLLDSDGHHVHQRSQEIGKDCFEVWGSRKRKLLIHSEGNDLYILKISNISNVFELESAETRASIWLVCCKLSR